MGNTSIKILIAYHKKSDLFTNDILVPINVGRANLKKDNPNYDWLLSNMIGDDTGENISQKNGSYNEITALYWAWKNYDKLGNPDYIGLMHYRRHFIFDDSVDTVVENVDKITENYLTQIGANHDNVERLLHQYDFLYYNGKVNSIEEHYANNHNIDDLYCAFNIVKDLYPEYSTTIDNFLPRSRACFGNMFVFKKETFFNYCEWLFSILDIFETKVDLTDKRLFISERLTGLFIQHLIEQGQKGCGLSSTFLREPVSFNIAFLYRKEKEFKLAVMLQSLVSNLKYKNILNFYVLYNGEFNKELFDAYTKSGINFNFIEISKKDASDEVSLPYKLIEILPTLNRCLFINENLLLFGDIFEMWESANNFEFPIIYSQENKGKRLLSLNLAVLRKINAKNNLDLKQKDLLGEYIKINKNFCHELPSWLVSYTNKEQDGEIIYELKRGDEDIARKVWYSPLFYYLDGVEPWLSFQSLFSIFWWRNAFNIPSTIKFEGFDIEEMKKVALKQDSYVFENMDYSAYRNNNNTTGKISFFGRIKAKVKKIIKRIICRK